MDKLNPQQRAAVQNIQDPLLVIAGAGSGKTRVITEKISYLVNQGRMPANRIAALTFTNKAAREMKHRVAKVLNGKQSRGLRVSTFHSLGLDILRKEYQSLGYKSGMTLLDDQDRLTLLRNLIAQSKHGLFDIDLVDHYKQQISHWKNAFKRSHQVITDVDAENEASALLYQEYERSIKAYNAIDFEDLILQPVFLFQDFPEILEKWQNKIHYFLVDEYQDTNLTQYQLVRQLAGKLGRFTVVGDDDQSIYAWRGAQPENLSQLEKDYSRLKVIKLEQNYRSTARILKVANHLISHNPHVFQKQLWSKLSSGAPIKVLSHKNEKSEAMQIVSEIIHHRFKTSNSYSDYAILYRSNHQSRLYERILRENSVPYFISGSTSFFSFSEIKDILAYLKLFVNSDDDAAFLRIINTPRREIGSTTLEKLGEYANRREISLFKSCREMGLRSVLSEKALFRLLNFTEWVEDIAKQLETEDSFQVIEAFIQQIDYVAWLQENSKTQSSAEKKMQNVSDLLDWLKRTAANSQEEDQSLSALLSRIMLMDILERNRETEAEDQVSLMTLHASKGLEFKNVYLIGMEEGILPHQTSIDEGDVEEERRLTYVGITRAKSNCTLSYCTHRKRYGEMHECEPSRFLSELPEEDLEWQKKMKLDENNLKARGKENLAHLKTMLT